MRVLRARVRDEDDELYFVSVIWAEKYPKLAEKATPVVLIDNPYGLMVHGVDQADYEYTVYPWDKVLWVEVEQA